MNQRAKQDLRNRLWDSVPEKLRVHFVTLRWFFYGARGSGRTYLACVLALLAVLDGQEGLVIDHTPYNPVMSNQIKHMLMGIADSLGIKIKIREQGGSYRISLVEEEYK